jgi:Bacteriophage probable baseplate hub protein
MSGDAALPLDVYVGQDFYVPSYQVWVEDQPFEELHDVLTVTYTDSLTAVDSFDMTVNNFDPDSGVTKFKYSDGSFFNPWKRVQLFLGYIRQGQDERRRMLTGEITTLTPNFPTSGGPTLNVRALNLLHRFRLKQETKPFFDQTETQIAQFVVKLIDTAVREQFPQLHLKLDPKDVSANTERERDRKVPFVLMNNQYPIVFLMERARRIGYELVIREMPTDPRGGDVIFGFGPTSNVERPTYVLEWGKTLISFQPTLRVADQVAKVTVRGWNPDTKKPIEKSVTRAQLDKKDKVVDPRDLKLAEPSLAQEITVDRPVSSEREAQHYAESILRQKASELVTAKGKTIGLPDLRSGAKVRIKGLGTRFSGTDAQPFFYVITDTTHTLGEGGYTTDFTARMEGGES